MATLNLKDGDKYPLKVTDVRPKNKQIPSKDGNMYWLFNAILVDKNNDFIQVEIRSLHQNDTGFDPNPAIYQYCEVVYVSNRQTPTVQACEPPGMPPKPASPLNAAQALVNTLPATQVGTGGKGPDPMNQERQPLKNCYQLNASGSVMAFATAYAKDLLVAEMGNRPKNSTFSDEDIERMLSIADMIAVGMCEKIAPSMVS